MTSTATTAYIVFGSLSVVLLLLPCASHIRARNTGTLIMIFWGVLGNFCQVVSSIIFRQTADNIAPGWSDFASIVGYVWPMGFSAGTLILLRRLFKIASTRQVMQTAAATRRGFYFELFLGFGLPLLMIPLHFCVQGHRVDIIYGHGPIAPLYISWVSIFAFQIWQLALCLVNLVYAVLVLRWFLMRRRQFTAVLASSSSGLNTNKYIRLMALSLTELAFGVPVAIYVFVANLTGQELNPYTSWEDVHHNFDTTYSITLDMISPDDARAVEFSRWVGVITAIIFFIFFGLTQEARSVYADSIDDALRFCRLSGGPKKAKLGSHVQSSRRTQPSYASQVPTLSRDPASPRSFADEEKGWLPSSKNANTSFGMTEYTVSSPGSATSFGAIDQTRTFGSIQQTQSFGPGESPNGEATFEQRYGPLSAVQVTTERIVVS